MANILLFLAFLDLLFLLSFFLDFLAFIYFNPMSREKINTQMKFRLYLTITFSWHSNSPEKTTLFF